MGRAQDPVRVVWISVVDAVAALLLVVAAMVVPWATLKDEVTGVTTVFRGGPLSLMLVTFAVCVVGLALLTLVWPSPALYGIQAAVGAVAVVVSVALALSKIALANQTVQAGTVISVTGTGTVLGTHATETSYAMGGAVAVAAAGTIMVASLIGLANSQMMGRSDHLADDLPAPALPG